MDYSPSPSKIKSQYAFLDNSIEIPRKPGYGNLYGTKVESPLKPVKDTETLHEKQRKFYSRYHDLASESSSPKRPSSKSYDATPTSRLFKTIDSRNVPVEDDVKINSNMIEKIIRENENLRQQLREQKREKELINGFANGLKEKLIKYKKLNDGLKSDLEYLTKENKVLSKQKELLESLQKNTEADSDEVKFKFNSDDIKDVFNEEQISNDDNNNNNNNNNNDKSKERGKQEEGSTVGDTAFGKKIKQLEVEISKINDNQDSKFEYIKNEIEFLKKLSLKIDDDKDELAPKEDDQIIRESEELQALQKQVDLFSRKLQIREENKLRKHKLTEELSKLTLQLERDDRPSSTASSHNSQYTAEQLHTPESQSSRSPIQQESKLFEQTLKKDHCEACEQQGETSKLNTSSRRWY